MLAFGNDDMRGWFALVLTTLCLAGVSFGLPPGCAVQGFCAFRRVHRGVAGVDSVVPREWVGVGHPPSALGASI
jgi:hypothetical protein